MSDITLVPYVVTSVNPVETRVSAYGAKIAYRKRTNSANSVEPAIKHDGYDGSQRSVLAQTSRQHTLSVSYLKSTTSPKSEAPLLFVSEPTKGC